LNRAPLPRRPSVAFVAALVAWIALVPPAARAAGGFDLDKVAEKAAKLAASPYRPPVANVPEWLQKISYDQWRDIRFRPEAALFRDAQLPFQVQLFHPGFLYDRTVAVQLVTRDRVTPVAFSPGQFDYGKNDFASRVPQDLGYAGFRMHAPIKTRNYYDEVIVFLGATYFRAVSRDTAFGLSARGLAVDTAESWGEEFPWFRRFWLVTPAANAKQMVVYALLDSPRVTGAYRFAIDPGEQTRVDVDCRLFLRKEIHKLGIAPLTSMFLHGENSARLFVDFRPETHDSDGILLTQGTGEWLWRPLDNPRTLRVNGFQMESPRGFALVQRDRDFDHYQDLETRPDRRPSVAVVPHGDWGRGRVELVEIPTNADTNDNVVAYWVPEQSPKPGEPAAFSYTLYWYADDPERPPGGRAIATRVDGGTQKDAQRFVIDFAGPNLSVLAADRVLHGAVTVVGGDQAAELLDQHVVKNPVTQGWRLTFQVRPKKRDVIELRAFLEENGQVLTETWSYGFQP
jgi:periplasmic glucans biosynthesis protein